MITRLRERGLLNWAPGYITDLLIRRNDAETNGPVHVMFCFVDHFEPFNEKAAFDKASSRVKAWTDGYPRMADNHRDSDGKKPQHTWFYPPHLDHCFLPDLVGLCKRGFGDMEMHLHHNHMPPFPDTSDSLKWKILQCIEDYSEFGIFSLPDGNKRFAFIHGDWSLDNARGSEFCGVNNEITILRECGCYADFTFPSLGIAQPRMINRMYYCKDDPLRPKSYDTGIKLEVGGSSEGDLLMVQGIVGLRWKSSTHRFRPSIEASNIDICDHPFPGRTDYWINNAVRIKGKPEWLFIKIHTHGAREADFDCLFGTYADKMHEYLEKNYNDGKRYVLHYVTAREMYNIIKAAEAGKEGNPGEYRDFEIPPYCYK